MNPFKVGDLVVYKEKQWDGNKEMEVAALGHNGGYLDDRITYTSGDWDLVSCIELAYRQPPADSVCAEADKTAGHDRQRDYGHPFDNHERIAGMWSVVLGTKLTSPITAEEVALCMCALKIAREINTPKRDNLVDLCGYAKCLEMIYAERERRKGEKK